ncbi:MAG: 1-deoxy-D-xylulose-5-phosphate reductoisomerase [Actinobacteria bacterium]|nr:1-deoxy-D-xylulose-5-phosphate reductoisomerase [Actinomycetota bacterium]
MTTLAVLGSTGSIGTQTLDVVRDREDAPRVSVLGAHRSVDLLARQAEEFRPDVVVVTDPAAAAELRPLLPIGVELAVGAEALASAAATADVVLNAVVGFAGLGVTLAALGAGRRLALANKESLVAAGPVVRGVLRTPGAELVPVDSEHSALHQCLRSGRSTEEVARLLLTASGGPFRGRSRESLRDVGVAEALAHPTWSMGPKITVDSSTLMNKGLEVIEAYELFDVPLDRIDVVVHPSSIVHSMVEFVDGSTIAQLSRPDMRLPVAYALRLPDRAAPPYGRIDWSTPLHLDFEPPDHAAFPCLGLAYSAARIGGTAPAWLNAANEVVVEAFLAGRLDWIEISEVLQASLARHDGSAASTVDDVVGADERARAVTAELLRNWT